MTVQWEWPTLSDQMPTPDFIRQANTRLRSLKPALAELDERPLPDFNVQARPYRTLVTGGNWLPALNAAYTDALAAGGGTIRVPAGTYNIASPGLKLVPGTAVSIRLEGDGAYATRLIGNGGYPVIECGSRGTGGFNVHSRVAGLWITNTDTRVAGSVGVFCDLPLSWEFDHVHVEDCEIGWKIQGAIYSQWNECDAFNCTTGIRMLDTTEGANTYPCNLYTWRGGRLWGGTQAIVSDTGSVSGRWINVNVSGATSGGLACVDYTNLNPVGYGPGIVWENGNFEANTSTLAEFQYSGSVFSPSAISNTTFISSGVARSVKAVSGALMLYNVAGIPLNSGPANIRYDSGTQGMIIGSSATPISIDAGATVSVMSFTDWSVGATVSALRVVSGQQLPGETTLVSGIDAKNGNSVRVTLTAARVVGVPSNPVTGQRIDWFFLQNATGGWGLTWNAVFKMNWSDAGNTANKRSSVSTVYDGTNHVQVGAQALYF